MSTTRFTRVAVVQLDYHPAAIYDGRAIIDDPLGSLRETIEVPDALLEALSERRSALRKRIREAYLGALIVKLRGIIRACVRWGVEVLVFPEYSIPWQVLEEVAKEAAEAPGMLVVAGTHAVSWKAREVYGRLGWAPERMPAQNTAVAPVIRGGTLVALVGKLNPSKIEEASRDFARSRDWATVPAGDFGSLAVLICIDFLFRENEGHRAVVGESLEQARLFAVPALTPWHTGAEFVATAKKDAERYGRPVLLANIAKDGGSSIFVDDDPKAPPRAFPGGVGALGAGEEGVIVANVDLGFVRSGEHTKYDAVRPVRPYAAASLVYRHTAELDEYAVWVEEFSKRLEQPDIDLDQVIAELRRGRSMVMAMAKHAGAPTRSGRLRRLFEDEEFEHVSVDRVRELTREVVLSEDALPFARVRHGLALGARQVVFGWQREQQVGLDAALQRLSEVVKAQHEALRPATQNAWEMLAARVVGDDSPETENAPVQRNHVLEMLFDELKVEDLVLQQQRSAGKLHQVEAELRRRINLLEKALESGGRIEHEAASSLQKLRIQWAGVLLDQQQDDEAKLVLEAIDEAGLLTEQRLRLAWLWAIAGEPSRARVIAERIASSASSPDLEATLARISIAEGIVPSSVPDDARVQMPAAWLQLQRGKAADAARLALNALTLSPPGALSALGVYVVLTRALHATIWDESWVRDPIPAEDRALVIATIDRLRREHLGAWTTFVEQPGCEKWKEGLYSAILCHHDAILEPDPWEELATVGQGHAAAEREAARLAQRGDVDEGLNRFDFTDRPWDRELKRTHLLLISGRIDEAREASQALVARFPLRAPLERIAAIVLYETGDRDRALEHARRAFEQVPAGGYLHLLIVCLMASERAKEAWSRLEHVWSTAGPTLVQLAATVADHLNLSDAPRVWERRVALVPGDLQSQLSWAQALFRCDEHDRAADVAWEAHEQWRQHEAPDRDAMPPAGLALIARLQLRPPGRTPKAVQRIGIIIDELRERFQRNPGAEMLRIQLELAIGREPSIDFPLLIEAGVAESIPVGELPQWLAVREHLAAVQWRLYQEGGISLAGLSRVRQEKFVETFLRLWNQPGLHFCAPNAIPDGGTVRLEKQELVVGSIELLLLAKLNLFEPLAALGQRYGLALLVLAREANELRAQYQQLLLPHDEDPEIERLSQIVCNWLGQGSVVRIIDESPSDGPLAVPELPPLRVEGDEDEALLQMPLRERLAQAGVVHDRQGRRLLTVDYFATNGVGSVDLALVHRWSTPEQYWRVTQYLRRAGKSLLSFPMLVRAMSEEGAISESQRRRVSLELAAQGFLDALDADDLLMVVTHMGVEQRAKIFDGLESMARRGGRSCGALGRYAIAHWYSKAIVSGCLGDRRDDPLAVISQPLSASRQARALAPDARAGLVLTLLSRVEAPDLTGDAVSTTLMFTALETVERFTAAFLPSKDGSPTVTLDEASPIGQLWHLLGEWAGKDGTRRMALDRAVRRAWVALDQVSPIEGPGPRSGPLMLAETTQYDVRVMSMAHECIAILSSNWSKNNDRPLTKLGVHYSPSDAHSPDPELDIYWEEVLAHGATSDPIRWRGGDRRRIVVDFDGGRLSHPLSLAVPIEAVVLRMSPDRAATGFAFALEVQGGQDGIAYESMKKLQAAPDDIELRRAYARHAAIAPWRLVRDDPASMARWMEDLEVFDHPIASLRSLRRMLHEPDAAIDQARASEVWTARKHGAWAQLDAPVLRYLAERVAEMPGWHGVLPLPNFQHRARLVFAVEQAIDRLEHADEHPVGALANDVRFLHIVAARSPVVDLRRGTKDLRALLPEILVSALDNIASPEQAPERHAMHRHETALLRVCAGVVQRALQYQGGIGTRDYLWLTYRLYAWLTDQLRFVEDESRANAIARLGDISASESSPEHGLASPELFDPFRFHAHGFQYRPAVFLAAIITGSQLVSRQAGITDLALTSAALERYMLELAARPAPQAVTVDESWVDWPLPVAVPDLAAYWLLDRSPERFFTMDPESLIRHIDRWPTGLGTLREGDWVLIEAMARGVAMRVDELPGGVVDAFARKLDSLVEDTPGKKVLWMGLTSLFARGDVERQDRSRTLADEHVDHELAPFFIGRFLTGVIGVGPELLMPEIDRLLDKAAEVPSIHMTVFAALARIVIHAKQTHSGRIARAALESLAQRPKLCDDPSLKAILAYLPAPTPPTPP